MGQIDNAQSTSSQGPLSCIPEFPQLPAGQEHTMDVVATFCADEIKGENERLPIRLSAVLDKSGSMAGSKLELVKGTTKFLVQQVIDKDCVGIVTYDSMVTEDAKVQAVTPTVKSQLAALIDQVHAGSCTNLSGGLFKGIQQLQEWNEPDVSRDANTKPVYSVFLFTDGQANEGITNADTLANAIQSSLAGFGPTVRIHTFGFGDDHDPTFLRKISEASGGDYYYVRTQEEIPTAFADALGGILSVSAQNVEMTISAGSEDVTIVDVNTSFQKEKLADGSFKVVFGDLFSEERKDVLLSIRVKPLTNPSDTANAVINLSARYLDVNAGTFCTRDMVLNVARPTAAPSVAPTPHPEVVSQRNRVQTAAAMQAAMQAAEQGNMEVARQALAAQVAVLSVMAEEESDESAGAMLADLQVQQQMYTDSAAYERVGAKSTASTFQAYSKQRKGTAMASAPVAARNKIQQQMVFGASAVLAPQLNQAPPQQPNMLFPPQQANMVFPNVQPEPNVLPPPPQQQQAQSSSGSSLLAWLNRGNSARK